MIQVVQLTPDQIAEQWNEIKGPLSESWPLVSEPEVRLNKILNFLIEGRAQLWVVIEDEKRKALAMTSIGFDINKMAKALCFLGMHIFEQFSVRDWVESLKVLSRFAKNRGCSIIIGNTTNKKILRLMKTLGGEIEYQAIFNVKDPIQGKKIQYRELEEVIV